MENTAKTRGRPSRKPSALFGTDLPIQKKEKSAPIQAVEENTQENQEVAVSSRRDMRPDLREESPLERANRRAREILNNGGLNTDGVDEFYIDPSLVPEGWSYEWKRKYVMGQEDPTYQLSLIQNGWEPVPASRHRQLMPVDSKYNVIERKGMILMERPLEITNEVRRRDRLAAQNAVKQREKVGVDSNDGLLARDDSRVAPKIKKGFEPMQIPD